MLANSSVSTLMYNDASLISHSLVGLSRLLKVFEDHCGDDGLTINYSKTESAVFAKYLKIGRIPGT